MNPFAILLGVIRCWLKRSTELTIRAYVAYEINESRSVELAMIISYPTSASGNIVLLKMPLRYYANLVDFIL